MNTGRLNATSRLAEWIATPCSWSENILEQAALAFVDTVGCMVAGGPAASTQSVVEAARQWGAGNVPVAGTSTSLPLPWAAMANGTAAHAIDFDDVLEPSLGHVSAVVVPTLLSIAATAEYTGAELLDAYIVGVEIMGRLGLALNMDHYGRGWHSTITLGTPAAAAAVARLYRLNPHQCRDALSISTSMSAGSKIQFGTSLKQLHAGLAAKGGIVAAQLGRFGLDASAEAFDGPWGLRGLMSGDMAPGFETALQDLGQSPPILARFGLMTKLYPCCAAMHRAVDGVLDLRAEYDLTHEQIESVQISLASVQTQNLRYPEPQAPSEARFSLQYCVAAALVDGELGLDSFEDAAIQREAVRMFARRVSMILNPDLPSSLPADARTPTLVCIRLKSGKILNARIEFQRGHAERPLSAEELKRKFRRLTMDALSRETSAELFDRISGLSRISDTAGILRQTMTTSEQPCERSVGRFQ